MKTNYFRSSSGTSRVRLGGSYVETILDYSALSEREWKASHSQLIKKEEINKKRNNYRGRLRNAIRRGQKLAIAENTLERFFALKDLKTGEILGRKEMTSHRAADLNFKLKDLGLQWIDLPY